MTEPVFQRGRLCSKGNVYGFEVKYVLNSELVTWLWLRHWPFQSSVSSPVIQRGYSGKRMFLWWLNKLIYNKVYIIAQRYITIVTTSYS